MKYLENTRFPVQTNAALGIVKNIIFPAAITKIMPRWSTPAAVSYTHLDVYKRQMLEPHTAAELSIDDIVAMVDELIDAHGDFLPKYH